MLNHSEKFNLPKIEEKILEFWQTNDIFKKSFEQRKRRKPFRFFEGPPTANGRPGIHHVLGRAFKDIIVRYKTMRGYYVHRQAGWDTHGLPVEIAVEKELGIKNKSEIEKFGIAEFNAKARQSVWRYKAEWERLTKRIGFWLDFDNPYITYDSKYIETLWWVLSRVHKRGLLKKLYKVVPWCPRCQTPLSSHELGQPGAYKKVSDPSIYIKFKLKANEYLLVWTTTPWTLPSNMAVAVNPALTYTKYRVGKDYVWSYNPPPRISNTDSLKIGDDIEVVEKMSGKKLVGRSYEPLFTGALRQSGGEAKSPHLHTIVAADFVSTEEGSGLVHLAPFGEEDLALWRKIHKEPIAEDFLVTIDDRGVFKPGFPWSGKFIKDADTDIVTDLRRRNLLHQETVIEHEYPFCWRCSAGLIYFPRFSWFIEMSKLRDDLIAANKKVNWIPTHIKEGRFGEWLREIKDWSLSRSRYWGTPLPIWAHRKEEKCSTRLVIGNFADLDKYDYQKNIFFVARHGEAEHNVNRAFGCIPERPDNAPNLTKRGIEQVKKNGQIFKKKGIDVIYASPFLRTKQTAEIISKITGAPVIFNKRIGEINAGVFNGQPVDKYFSFFTNKAEEFVKTVPGGENLTNIRVRVTAFLKEINAAHRNKKILIVSHGYPLWMIAASARGLSLEDTLETSYPDPGGWAPMPYRNVPTNHEGELDPHRPFVDAVLLACPDCKEKMERVPDVADVWFDSGAMPFAAHHYPFEDKEVIDKRKHFPADYISEGMDQTRGWFYTLMAISVLLGYKSPYKNVISFGLLLDKFGHKMSKSKGNVVDPWEMIEKYGADAVRWYFYTANDPGEPIRFDEKDLKNVLNKVFTITYNSFAFFKMYENSPSHPIPILDQWIENRLYLTKSVVAEKLDAYDVVGAGRVLEGFIDDLSRWYIRRSRKNFSPKTLYLVLLELSRLLAPFVPFFSEALYQSLQMRGPKARLSVHLEDWNDDNFSVDQKLLRGMDEVRRLSSIGLALREAAHIKVRQPLQKIIVKSEKLKGAADLLEILKDEVNVREVAFNGKLAVDAELDTKLTDDLKREGLLRELTRVVQGARKDAGCKPGELIELYISSSDPAIRSAVQAGVAVLKKSVSAKAVHFEETAKPSVRLETELGGQKVVISIKRL